MASDKLYGLALQYKKTKLWKTLMDSTLFAVRLADGQIGYCCVMGELGEHIALALYIGAEGFDSYQRIADPNLRGEMQGEYEELGLIQNCLQCSFENKDMLSPEERKEAQQYAKKYGVSYRGRKSFPQFVKYQPFRYPWTVEQEDQEYLCQALSAAIEVAKKLETQDMQSLGFQAEAKAGDPIPMLEYGEAGYIWGTTLLPQPIKRGFPSPELDEFTAARLKGVNRAGTWACKLLRMFQPVQMEANEAPYFPVMLLSMDCDSEYVLPGDFVVDYETNANQVLTGLAQCMLDEDYMPKTIQVSDRRTEALLKRFCARVGITLQMCTALPELEQVIEDLMEHLSGRDITQADMLDDMDEMFSMLMELPSEALETMPKEVFVELMELDERGMLPAPLSKKLHDIFGNV